MNLSLCLLLCNFLVSSIFIVVAGENANIKKNVSKKEEKADNKGIYFDDEDMEGSGNGDNKLDLESSGSGDGPDDDEDTPNPGSFSGVNTKPEKASSPKTIPMPVTKSSPPTSPTPETETPTGGIETKVLQESTSKNSPDKDISGVNPMDKIPVEDNNQIDNNRGVYMINPPERDRTTSFFAQPGILAAVIGGAVVGLLCAILVVMFIVYRMKKKDEGSYALEEMKRCPATNPYMKPNHREFFA